MSSIDLKGMAPLLQVYDVPTSIRFYRDILEFKVTQSSGTGDDVDWAMLERGDTCIMLNTRYEKPDRPANRDEARQSIHEDTALYFGCPDIANTYEILKKKGVRLEPPSITGYGFKAIYVRDPDGFELVFHWPIDK